MPDKIRLNKNALIWSDQGFSLIETLIALLVLAVGLLAATQLISIAMGSRSLSRSKQMAAVVAQSQLEHLGDLYRQDASAMDLAPGNHGPREVRVLNPVSGTELNCFSVSWIAGHVSDPRPGKILQARQVTVTVTPAQSQAADNVQVPLNKVLNMTTIFSRMIP